MRYKGIKMVMGSIPRSYPLCSFSLMKKNEKNQDVAKLPPHLAERWPAATSAHRAYPINI
jgi:hypothetical protein